MPIEGTIKPIVYISRNTAKNSHLFTLWMKTMLVLRKNLESLTMDDMLLIEHAVDASKKGLMSKKEVWQFLEEYVEFRSEDSDTQEEKEK